MARASGSPWKLPPEITSPVREDERVVGGGIHLDVQHALQLVERVPHRAMDLGHAAQRVGVLDLVVALGV